MLTVIMIILFCLEAYNVAENCKLNAINKQVANRT